MIPPLTAEETENPFPKSRLKGVKAEGVRFEKAVVLRLRSLFAREQVLHNPWYKYYDELGSGIGSPDVLVVSSKWLLLGECKRTFRAEAFAKLQHFYLPLVAAVWPGRYYGLVQFCKHLSPEAKGIALTTPEAVLASRPVSPQLIFWP